MWHYCYSCGQWAELDRQSTMCADCLTVWSDNRSRTVSEQIERLLAS
jgi:hypothetical protein